MLSTGASNEVEKFAVFWRCVFVDNVDVIENTRNGRRKR